ncbi:lysozyme [Streptomyces sp. NA04227]|nr:lysozyme [Streptomyces sp. NA04227]QKW05788.1 lysozyme [Streptomyces sp. NA04227]
MAHAPQLNRRRARLISVAVASLALTGTTLATSSEAVAVAKPRGHDVSSHQGKINWSQAKKNGARFVYIKATEATNYRNPYFASQYNGSYRAGIIRGAYHFALPNKSSGKTQAQYFLKHGGKWSPDGKTLPPALDIEHNPYGANCYGMSPRSMVNWIQSFSDEVKRVTKRRPVIYTSTKWWNACTGKSRAFAKSHPLWLANWSSSPGPMPAGWSFQTFWQHSTKGKLPGDQNVFNGAMSQLNRFASR